ncbi:MAG: VOC family protein [Chloroflexi bacterium]|nr:MAG: VOC family protein [Chloroflexota bacterium]
MSAEFRGRFDHAVILVADLARASAAFTKLGFSVSPGGAHTGLGTHNALVRFGVDYLELLAIRDEEEALRARGSTAPIVERLRSGRGGLASFALATADRTTRRDSPGRDPALTRTARGASWQCRSRSRISTRPLTCTSEHSAFAPAARMHWRRSALVAARSRPTASRCGSSARTVLAGSPNDCGQRAKGSSRSHWRRPVTRSSSRRMPRRARVLRS